MTVNFQLPTTKFPTSKGNTLRMTRLQRDVIIWADGVFSQESLVPRVLANLVFTGRPLGQLDIGPSAKHNRAAE